MSKFNNKNNEEVPKDYFVKFGEKILNKTIEEELFEASDYPILNSIDKSKDFNIPKSYLSNFESIQNVKSNKRFSLYRAIAMAASLLLVVTLFTLSKNSTTNTENKQVASIDNIDILSDDLEDLELNELVELQDLFDEQTGDELIFTELDHDKILDYLLEESDAYDLAFIY